MKIILKPQEENSDSKFNGQLVATRNFTDTFGKRAFSIAVKALKMIKKQRVPSGADYLQVCLCEGVTFWLIDDGEIITALMPEDY